MSDTVYLTKEGLEKLKQELSNLTAVRRVEVAHRIKTARDFGDISENSEYDAARTEQAFIEGRIAELEDIIKNAQVSDTSNKEKVQVGSKVTVHIEGSDAVFFIVGAPEANPAEKKISHESPIGSALLDKKVGEEVIVEVPVGKLTYKVLKIE